MVIDGTRLGKPGQLIDGTIAHLRLTADHAAVLELHVEGPSFRGTIKSFDPEKNTLTLLVGAKGGVGGEDHDFKLTKETAVVTEFNAVPLPRNDLRVDREVVVRLAIDQKAAARVTVMGE